MTRDLFDDQPWQQAITDGAVVLRGHARQQAPGLLADVGRLTQVAPFRHMQTASGAMSVAMSNCGLVGWVSDKTGYRYDPLDPLTRMPWPPMPEDWRGLARAAADAAGFPGFEPDACLINRYEPGAKMGLHQDRDERDLRHPIVSVSLGVPATFQFGGARRSDPVVKIPLSHGDIVVWGGPARLYFHGVLTLKQDEHPLTGQQRINLTFRKVT
ncbi:DNA oxidative demethylase AlkB [Oxalobacteraceae bacterium A2-2]